MTDLLREIRAEMKELKDQGRRTEETIKQKVDKVRKELEERERRWNNEKAEMENKIKVLEKRMEE